MFADTQNTPFATQEDVLMINRSEQAASIQHKQAVWEEEVFVQSETCSGFWGTGCLFLEKNPEGTFCRKKAYKLELLGKFHK